MTKITISIEVQSIAEASELLSKLSSTPPKAAAARAPAPVTPIKQPAKPTAPAKQAEEALDYEKDVKPVALQLSRNPALRPKLIEIYKGFGVSVGSELKSEQLNDALMAMKEALGE